MSTATSGAYDLEIEKVGGGWIGLMLAERLSATGDSLPKQLSAVLAGVASDTPIGKRLVPVVQEDWSGGVGIDYDVAPGVYTRSPGYACPAGAAHEIPLPLGNAGGIAGWAELNGVLYVAQSGTPSVGGRVLRVVPGATLGAATLTQIVSFPVGEYVRGMAAYNGTGQPLLYISTSNGGLGNGRLVTYDGATVGGGSFAFGTNGRGALARVYWVTEDNVGGPRLVAISGPYKIAYTLPFADPLLASSWVEDNLVDTVYQLSDIKGSRTRVFLASRDGVRDFTAMGETPNLTVDLEQMPLPGNADAIQYHDGYLYYSTSQGLNRINVDSSLLDENPGACAPGLFTRTEYAGHGPCTAMTIDQQYLVAAMFDTVTRQTSIYWGKDRRIVGRDSPNPLIWYGPEVLLTSDYRVTKMHVSSSSGQLALWIGAIGDVSGTPKVAAVSLPMAGAPIQDMVSIGTHRFTTGQAGGWLQPYSRLIDIDQTWDDKVAKKLIHEHGFGTRGLSITRAQDDALTNDGLGTKLVSYTRADAAPASEAWGTGADVTISPAQTVVPAATVSGHKIGRRIDFISPSGAATPPKMALLDALRTTAWKVEPTFNVLTPLVEYGEGVFTRENSMDQEDVDAKTAALEAVMANRTTLRLPDGKLYTIRLEQVLDRDETIVETGQHKHVQARLEITVIGVSA